MKRFLLISIAASVAMILTAAPSHARSGQTAVLPEKARKFVTEHFPEHVVSYVIGEKNSGSPMQYEVMFTDKSFVTFDRYGRWTEVQCGLAPVPAAIIPESIMQYVKQKFPAGTFITEIERDRQGYGVELSNDAELEFDRNGKFRRAEY